jgi:flagellar biosynthetic protein FlhB
MSMHAIKFNLSKLNPVSGMGRLVDKKALIRLAIALGKLMLLLMVGWSVLGSRLPALVTMGITDAPTSTSIALGALSTLGMSLTLLLGAVALTDFVIQRRQARSRLRMTRDEVKRENKDQEGDPLIRGQRRRRARQLAFARMMDAVPTADVVVVNPIRLAVALKYDSLTMRAPRIVAKGQRLMAARIRDTAREHGVPIIEDVPLARALFPRAIGTEVPPDLYRAVARILIIVHKARFGRRQATVGGAL